MGRVGKARIIMRRNAQIGCLLLGSVLSGEVCSKARDVFSVLVISFREVMSFNTVRNKE